MQYRTVLREAGGSLFAAALLTYDRFMEQRRQGGDPLTDRIIRVMEINPKIDMDAFMLDDPENFFAGTFYTEVDASGFRRQDRRYLRVVCRLVCVCLVGAILDTLKHPEREGENRAELETALDVIRRGSVEGGKTT
ncbi:MAG: hypothetical protein IJT94_13145, partial [Oscillibacter sp.]|nr:hypothetical protein [Oscillibacter sp.]